MGNILLRFLSFFFKWWWWYSSEHDVLWKRNFMSVCALKRKRASIDTFGHVKSGLLGSLIAHDSEVQRV